MSQPNPQQYFKHTRFFSSVFNLNQLPPLTNHGKEIVISGYSNCGKSSIINSITQKNGLAITSKQPGRTKSINYFQLNHANFIVDLPGYGYAAVATSTKLFWSKLLQEYLVSRKNIVGVIIVMDVRRPFKPLDLAMLELCCSYNLEVHLVLNKADQISKSNALKTLDQTTLKLNQFKPGSTQLCSTLNSSGIAELQHKIIQWFEEIKTI